MHVSFDGLLPDGKTANITVRQQHRGLACDHQSAEREPGVHVELDLAVRQHVRPERRGQAAFVLGGEHALPFGVGEVPWRKAGAEDSALDARVSVLQRNAED